MVTGLYYGCPIELEVDHPELPPRIQATFVGFAGGPQAMVILAGTEERVWVPRSWIRRASVAA